MRKRKFEDGGYVSRDTAPSERGRTEREFRDGVKRSAMIRYAPSLDKDGELKSEKQLALRKKVADEIREQAYKDSDSYGPVSAKARYRKGGLVKAKAKKPASKKKR